MPLAVTPEAENLEEGYRVAPLHAGGGSPLRVGLLVQISPDAVGGAFVLLRETADASIYLGAVTDAEQRVREWLEIWVQNIDRFAASFPAYRDWAFNAVLDERWTQRVEAYRALEPASFLALGWEAAPSPPILFDANLQAPDTAGASWELCQDDALLAQKGLPPFSTSLSRYLHQPSAGVESFFVPITSESPESDATRPFAETFPGLLAFNPGGRMMAHTFAPIAFDQWVDILSGVPWRGIDHGGDVIRPGGVYRLLQDSTAMQYGGGHLFLGRQGIAGRLAETFHLKLLAIASAFRLVRAHVQTAQLPLLNVSDATFRISLSESDAALPFLWSFRTTMAVPGEAMALPVATTEARYFVPAKFGKTSIYRPASLHAPVDAAGQVRIRKVTAAKPTEVVIEGTLVTQERIVAGGSDLIWLRVPLPGERIDLYAKCEASESAAAAEFRFRTLPQLLPPNVVAALQEAEGVVFPEVPFQTVPLFSTPCDLYALAVLAIRTLLVDDEMSLPVALDEFLSLASKAATTYDPDVPADENLHAIVVGHPKIKAALGPHRLVRAKLAPDAALFPPELWWDALAIIMRCFPGTGPDSFCRDFGDAQPLALESVFNEPLAALDQLLVRSRSLIIVDWAHNREIRSVIDKLHASTTP